MPPGLVSVCPRYVCVTTQIRLRPCLACPESAGLVVLFLGSWDVVFELWVSCAFPSGPWGLLLLVSDLECEDLMLCFGILSLLLGSI